MLVVYLCILSFDLLAKNGQDGTGFCNKDSLSKKPKKILFGFLLV
jgi:hypothetical protein